MADGRARDLFSGAERLTLADAQDLTLASLAAYGARYEHWGVAYSGGKDSTATLTFLLHLIESGLLPLPPELAGG